MAQISDSKKMNEKERSNADVDIDVGFCEDVAPKPQHLHRKLRGKEVQLFAIGGAIGTCKFDRFVLEISSGLPRISRK